MVRWRDIGLLHLRIGQSCFYALWSTNSLLSRSNLCDDYLSKKLFIVLRGLVINFLGVVNLGKKKKES